MKRSRVPDDLSKGPVSHRPNELRRLMDRSILAYLLLGALAGAVALFVAYRIFYSRNRVYRRRRAREEAAHNRLMAERDV